MNPSKTRFTTTTSFDSRKRYVRISSVLSVVAYVAGVFLITVHPGSAWEFRPAALLIFAIIATAGIIAAFIFFRDRGVMNDFLVSDTGISASATTYPWTHFRYYHWLGDAQEERIGLLRFHDPVNPYRAAGVWVVRLHIRRPWLSLFANRYVNLAVDGERKLDLEELLHAHGIRHVSPWWMAIVGVRPLQSIALLIIPFLLLGIVIAIANLAPNWFGIY